MKSGGKKGAEIDIRIRETLNFQLSILNLGGNSRSITS